MKSLFKPPLRLVAWKRDEAGRFTIRGESTKSAMELVLPPISDQAEVLQLIELFEAAIENRSILHADGRLEWVGGASVDLDIQDHHWAFFFFPPAHREAMLGDMLEQQSKMRAAGMSERQIYCATAIHVIDGLWRTPTRFVFGFPAVALFVRLAAWVINKLP